MFVFRYSISVISRNEGGVCTNVGKRGGGVNMREAHIYIKNRINYTELDGGGGSSLTWGVVTPTP